MFYLSYPERMEVTEEKMQSWANDAISNGEIEGPVDEPIEELARQLENIGVITVMKWEPEIVRTEKTIKETASAGSIGAHSVGVVPSRLGSKINKRKVPVDLKGFLVNYYNKVKNKAVLYPVNVYKLNEGKIEVLFSLNEKFNIDSVLSQLSSFENKNTIDPEDITTYGVEDDKGNLMKVTILKTQEEDFQSYVSSYLSELQNFKDQGIELEDVSLAELLYRLKDLFDIRDVEFPNIPDNIVYNADEASESFEEFEGNELEGSPELGGDEFSPENEEMGDEFSPEGMGMEGEEGELGDLEGEEFGEEGFSDSESVEDFEDFEDETNTESLLNNIINMLKAQAETEKAKAEAEAEKARAVQAEYSSKAAEATLKDKEELVAMEAERDKQKQEEKNAKKEKDLAVYRYKKSKGMMNDAEPQFEGFSEDSILMQALFEEDIVTDENLLRREQSIEMRKLQQALTTAQTQEERAAIQKQLSILPRKFAIKRQEAKARLQHRDATEKAREEEMNQSGENTQQEQQPQNQNRAVQSRGVVESRDSNSKRLVRLNKLLSGK